MLQMTYFVAMHRVLAEILPPYLQYYELYSDWILQITM